MNPADRDTTVLVIATGALALIAGVAIGAAVAPDLPLETHLRREHWEPATVALVRLVSGIELIAENDSETVWVRFPVAELEASFAAAMRVEKGVAFDIDAIMEEVDAANPPGRE